MVKRRPSSSSSSRSLPHTSRNGDVSSGEERPAYSCTHSDTCAGVFRGGGEGGGGDDRNMGKGKAKGAFCCERRGLVFTQLMLGYERQEGSPTRRNRDGAAENNPSVSWMSTRCTFSFSREKCACVAELDNNRDQEDSADSVAPKHRAERVENVTSPNSCTMHGRRNQHDWPAQTTS